jgi:hypothetical protein
MLDLGNRHLGPAVLLVAALWTLAAPACNVPVFRYALERWEADPYELVVFHREPLSTEQRVLLERITKTEGGGSANVVVTDVNLAGELSPAAQALWRTQQNPTLPWMLVKYPRPTKFEQPAWAGALNADTIGALLDSPARRDIARELVSGTAVVWLVLVSGDKQRDVELGQLVEAELRKLEQSLVLPKPLPDDPPIAPELPLKVAFSMVLVARSDPAERVLVNLLLNWNTNLLSRTETMLFPVFGRGRVIPPAIGNEIRTEAIRDMAEFLTGPCSCEVKQMNPGYDMLLAANWSSLPGYQEVALPDLPMVGLSQFAATATNASPAPASIPAPSLASASAATPRTGSGRLVWNVVVVLGLGMVALSVGTLLLRAKAQRKSR